MRVYQRLAGPAPAHASPEDGEVYFEWCLGPAHVDVPIDRLTSAEHAAAHAESIKAGERASVTRLAQEPKDTTHVCVVDRDGNAL